MTSTKMAYNKRRDALTSLPNYRIGWWLLYVIIFTKPTLCFLRHGVGFVVLTQKLLPQKYAETSRTVAFTNSFTRSNKTPYYHPFPSKWKEGITTHPHNMQLTLFYQMIVKILCEQNKRR